MTNSSETSESKCPFAYLTKSTSPKAKKFAHESVASKKPFGMFLVLPFYGFYLITAAAIFKDFSCPIQSFRGFVMVYMILSIADIFVPEESVQWVIKRKLTWSLTNYILLPLVIFFILGFSNVFGFVTLALTSMIFKGISHAVNISALLNGTVH